LKKVKFIDHIIVLIRSFFIQALWNFESMQSLGIAYAVYPALKRLYKNKEKRKDVVLEYMEFFNTNPFLASGLIGAFIAEEEKQTDTPSRDRIKKLKITYMGPLAALGDNFIWAKVNPFLLTFCSALFAVLFINLNLARGNILYVLVPAAYLIMINIVTVTFRVSFYIQGYRLGGDLINYIGSSKIKTFERLINAAALLLLGFLIVDLFYFLTKGLDISEHILRNIIVFAIWLYLFGQMYILQKHTKRLYNLLYILIFSVLIIIIRK